MFRCLADRTKHDGAPFGKLDKTASEVFACCLQGKTLFFLSFYFFVRKKTTNKV